MIKKSISRTTFQEHLITLIKDELAIEAIKDDGIYSTFEFNYHCLKDTGILKVNLYYGKRSALGDAWYPVQKKIFYINCPEFEFKDVTLPYLCAEVQQKVADRIKMDMVKKDNAIWSTIHIEPRHDHFDVSYEKVLAHEDPHLTTSRYLGASDLEIENTKRTLNRLELLKRNAIYGLYPFTSTCAFDEKSKEDLKASLKTWKAKAEAIEKEGRWKSWEPALKYAEADAKATKEAFEFIHKKEEKEKKDMNVTLLVIPDGMNKDFVNRVKANFQSNNSQRLFVSSVDIDYDSEHEPIKTKYDLFEYWIKTGMVDIVYFMLGFEKDPDVRAFESFVRGVTETEVPGKIDVRVVYQKDDIENDIQHLRTAYFDEADAEEDLERAGNRVVREAKVLKEVYSLNNTGLDIIKYSKGKIDASDELVINDIMDTAFASDEDTKPAKKGGKK